MMVEVAVDVMPGADVDGVWDALEDVLVIPCCC